MLRFLTGDRYARVLGLTGSIASGKSHARTFLGELGAVVVDAVDADALGHRAYARGSRGFRNVVAAFGEGIVDRATGTWAPTPPLYPPNPSTFHNSSLQGRWIGKRWGR
jgi:Dephospho-CoA kinase